MCQVTLVMCQVKMVVCQVTLVRCQVTLVMNVSVVNFTLVPRRFVKVSVTRFTLSVVFSEEMSLFLLQHYLFSGRMQKLV